MKNLLFSVNLNYHDPKITFSLFSISPPCFSKTHFSSFSPSSSLLALVSDPFCPELISSSTPYIVLFLLRLGSFLPSQAISNLPKGEAGEISDANFPIDPI